MKLINFCLFPQFCYVFEGFTCVFGTNLSPAMQRLCAIRFAKGNCLIT